MTRDQRGGPARDLVHLPHYLSANWRRNRAAQPAGTGEVVSRSPHRLSALALPLAPRHGVGRQHLLPEAATEEQDTRESRETGAASGRQEVPRDRFPQVGTDPTHPPRCRCEAPGGPGSLSARSRGVKPFPCLWAAPPLGAAPRVGRAWAPAAPFSTDETRPSLPWVFPCCPHLGLPSAKEFDADEQRPWAAATLTRGKPVVGAAEGIRLRRPSGEREGTPRATPAWGWGYETLPLPRLGRPPGGRGDRRAPALLPPRAALCPGDPACRRGTGADEPPTADTSGASGPRGERRQLDPHGPTRDAGLVCRVSVGRSLLPPPPAKVKL